MGQDIEGLNWMTPETKKQALIKLHAITNKIGYPDTWRDYSSVDIMPMTSLAMCRGRAIRNQAQPEQDRQASRSRRVEHDSADGKRRIQSAAQ